MMNPKLKRFFMYALVSIAFVALGYGLLFTCGSDLVKMVKAQISMAMTKGAPNYPNDFDENLYKGTLKEGNVESQSEVPYPALQTSYAKITCDHLEIAADVYYGDDDISLEKGVGQYTGSSLFGFGKPILIGGHDTTYFAGLEQAQKGDVFEVATNYGHYTYEVTKTGIAKATDSSAYNLDQKEEQLILYTCYPFGKISGNRKDRYFVYCKRTDNNGVIKQENTNSSTTPKEGGGRS